MMKIHEKPCADKGYKSYRYSGNYGWIMIGANSHIDAINEANRSLSTKDASMDKLQVWDGEKYSPAIQ